MNGWERWTKRFLKGFLWAPVFFGGAWLLDLPVTWQLLLVVTTCGLWSNILDDIWPTAEAEH